MIGLPFAVNLLGRSEAAAATNNPCIRSRRLLSPCMDLRHACCNHLCNKLLGDPLITADGLEHK